MHYTRRILRRYVSVVIRPLLKKTPNFYSVCTENDMLHQIITEHRIQAAPFQISKSIDQTIDSVECEV